MTPLLKIPLLFSDAIGMRITGKPPNSPLPPEEHIVPDWRERFLKSLAWPCVFLRGISWSLEIIETVVILLASTNHPFPEYVLSRLEFRPHASRAIAITPLFLLGNALTMLGTFLRLQCYHTLGRFFTFELSIQQGHRLITDGPYAVVRHPSYTGMILTIVGAICSQATGSWVTQSGLLDMWLGKLLVGYWILVASAVVLSLCLRTSREDEMLEKKFGEQWIEWSRRVPYSLVPGVY
ncbi:ICMT-domain-containing protein [Hymenopellis radicata]|nr:ICMT-domain-containing protein [Hymenopellis radicata]